MSRPQATKKHKQHNLQSYTNNKATQATKLQRNTSFKVAQTTKQHKLATKLQKLQSYTNNKSYTSYTSYTSNKAIYATKEHTLQSNTNY